MECAIEGETPKMQLTVVLVEGARQVWERIEPHLIDNHVGKACVRPYRLFMRVKGFVWYGCVRPDRLRSDSPRGLASSILSDGPGALLAVVHGAKVTKGMAAGPWGVGGRRQRRQQHLPRQQRPTNRAAEMNVVPIELAALPNCGVKNVKRNFGSVR